MPRITDHPGVSIAVPERQGYPLHLIFGHPILGKRVKRSVRTTDSSVALGYARELSAILRNPAEWKDPKASDAVVAVWRGDIIEQAVTEAVREARYAKPADWESFEVHQQAWATQMKAKEATEDMVAENGRLKERIAILTEELRALRGLLKTAGRDVGEKYTPKAISDAVTDYLTGADRGTRAGDRYQETMEPTLRRFARWLPANANVAEVTPTQVKAHLIELLAGKMVREGRAAPGVKTVKKVAQMLNNFLEHQSPCYDAKTVKQWVRANCGNEEDAEPGNPYWLDQADVDALLKHLPAYWRDVAELQWAGGFRPEELAFLQTSGVTFGEDIRVEVAMLKDGKRIVWKAKTRSSYGRVHILSRFRPLLERLKARGATFLFPDDTALHAGPEHRYEEGEAFERQHRAWRRKSFCAQYLATLRDAAQKAGLEVERVDCRTMRRSCGKRVLLETKSPVHAAAILRDTVKVVLQHYAKLIPDDMKQPEPAAN